jgi:hypothetical protein
MNWVGTPVALRLSVGSSTTGDATLPISITPTQKTYAQDGAIELKRAFACRISTELVSA